jgi:hypothetical protein
MILFLYKANMVHRQFLLDIVWEYSTLGVFAIYNLVEACYYICNIYSVNFKVDFSPYICKQTKE